jgi:uncharacterized membrane protein
MVDTERIAASNAETRRSPELLISYVLRYGVALCSAVIALGLVARLAHLGPVTRRSRDLIALLMNDALLSPPVLPHSPAELREGLLHFRPDVIMAAGLLLLIALPILRVALTVVVFLFERDWAFLAITLFVLSVLVFGLLHGSVL